MKQIVVTLLICVAAAWTLWPRTAYSHNPTTTTVLFNREIASLLQRKCLQCHADGKLAMPLVTYNEARPWAEAIKDEILSRRMPPWPAERGYGAFSTDIGLTPREFEFLISWVDGGVPEGEGNAPEFIDHSAHWMLGAPDAVLTATSGTIVKAGSAPAFKSLIIDTGLTRETWVRGFDFKPGDARVVRAAFFSVAGTDRYLGGWTPWHSSTELPEGVAFKLPPRARIAVDVLYSGTTETVTDIPRLAMYVASSVPAGAVSTSMLRPAASGEPGIAGVRVAAELRMPASRALVAIRPEMQQGGRSLELKLVRPDGSREVLLWVKNFRQDWQTPYVFRKPVALPAGSLLQATAYFDAPPPTSAKAPFTIALNHYADGPAPDFAKASSGKKAGPSVRTTGR
jgi:hypothetical protein